MFLIVGLGNIGSSYIKSRHNVGFMAVDSITHDYNLGWTKNCKLYVEIAIGFIETYKVLFIKPQTYMNLSGIAVRKVKDYYNICSENIIVLHDDIDLPLGKVKYKFSGGTGGHNGLKSINKHIDTCYHKVRIGIAKPNCNIAQYVLSDFYQHEYLIIMNCITLIKNNIIFLLEKKVEQFNNNIYK